MGLVASADDEDEIVFWKSINGHPSGSGVSGEIVVVIFDTVNFADEFETMR